MKSVVWVRLVSSVVLGLLALGISCRGAGQTRAWTDRFDAGYVGTDRPVGVRVDGYGNVYVAGSSWRGASNSFDVFVAKYTPAGTREWVAYYDSPAHGVDWARRMALDSSGAVYVTGYSEGAGTSYDCLTLRVSASGSVLWAARHDGPASAVDEGRDVAVDAASNVYVCGHSAGLSNYDWVVIKYNSAGAEQWVKRFDGGAHDYARALTLDSSGNVIVTGTCDAGPSAAMDCLTIKYAPSGAVAWQRTYDGPGKGLDAGVAVAAQADGRIVVAAESHGLGTWRDYAVLGYTSGGTLSWSSRHDGSASKDDIPFSLALDAAGSVFVTGSSVTAAGTRDILTISLDPNGGLRWTTVVDRSGGDDIAVAVSVDDTRVAVVGRTATAISPPRMLVVSLSPSGSVRWTDEYVGPSGGSNEGLYVQCAGSGSMVATGVSWGGYGTDVDAAVISYGADTSTPTSLTTIDRSGTITEATILRGYLKRTSDNAWLDGKTVLFRIGGTLVGSAVTGWTGTSGRADLTWTITDGPATRTILAEFAGDASYNASSGTATLTANTVATKMSGLNRDGKITAYRILKAWLWRMDNSAVRHKTIAFKLDGTLLGTDVTRTTGLAQIGYTIADGAGAGTRTILAEWAGDGGYLASSCTNSLTVYKATPYIWVMPRSVPQGGVARLYAYFRRLADYQKQAGKTVAFKIDGTPVADVVTLSGAEAGIARYQYTTVEPPGVHTIRCEFAGDAWVDAGYGEGNLTIY